MNSNIQILSRYEQLHLIIVLFFLVICWPSLDRWNSNIRILSRYEQLLLIIVLFFRVICWPSLGRWNSCIQILSRYALLTPVSDHCPCEKLAKLRQMEQQHPDIVQVCLVNTCI